MIDGVVSRFIEELKRLVSYGRLDPASFNEKKITLEINDNERDPIHCKKCGTAVTAVGIYLAMNVDPNYGCLTSTCKSCLYKGERDKDRVVTRIKTEIIDSIKKGKKKGGLETFM